jgi:16S rRNA (adenine1518-N6/adenine1519-N6)-dimethyltransferase
MNKRLGQHFLKNKSAIDKIIVALDIQPNETIIEIGPGKGVLTVPLIKECIEKKCHLIGIEKDIEFVKKLNKNIQFSTSPDQANNLQMIEGDILKILPEIVSDLKLEAGNWKLVGNIPYYITGKLLRILSELKNKPILTILMIQEEVAERITAQIPKTNLLSAATQFWADPEIIFKLKPEDFKPAPKVNSATIKLITRTLTMSELEVKNYYRLIHIIFKQPRKTLINNLKNGTELSREELVVILKSLNFSENCRPQNLTIDNILELIKKIDF